MIEAASLLQIRLRSCLQAILELEPELQKTDAAGILLTELSVLKEIYNKIETLLIQEDDVKRIEEATASFFEELKGSITRDDTARPEQRFLQ